MNHRSLAFRLAVWYALLLSATFALVGFAMYFGVEQYLRANLRDSLSRRSEQTKQILRSSSMTRPADYLPAAIETQIAPEFNNRFLRITRWPDAVLYRSGWPADRGFDPAAVALPVAWTSDLQTRRVELPSSGPMLVASVKVDTGGGVYLIELGGSLEPIEALRERLLLVLGLLLPVLVVLAAGGGYLLVDRALRPVDVMSKTAERISIQDLNARLPVPQTGDALQRLSVSMNHMLGRLRDSVQASQRFLADASHELRTPLTIVKCELEEIVSSPHSTPVVADRIGSVLEEVGQLKQLVEGLLVLSRLDTGEAQREMVNLDLAELVASTAEQMRLVAEDGGVALICSDLQSAPVQGDRARLKQVVVNLLDNALKYTARGGTVTLKTRRSGRHAIFEVRDTGIGLPPAALTHIFDRFYRVDNARSRETGGVGLGLSIVSAICAAHGAEIEVNSTLGVGSSFTVQFPAMTQAAVTPLEIDMDPAAPAGDANGPNSAEA